MTQNYQRTGDKKYCVSQLKQSYKFVLKAHANILELESV